MKKNEIYRTSITGMTNEGNGVGRVNNMTVFIPLTAVGDVIDVKIVKVLKSYAFGIVENIVEPSETRQVNDCSAFTKCGGCSFRHINYNAELDIKDNFVRDAFRRLGHIETEFKRICGCESSNYYRNKAMYPVAESDGKLICGFYSKRSHRVVPFTACKLQPKIFEGIVNDIITLAQALRIKAYDETLHCGDLRHIYIRQGFHSKEIMVCFVTNKWNEQYKKIAEVISQKYQDIKSIIVNKNSKNTNVILGDECINIYGKDTITDTMCGNKVELSPFSFYQVNTIQAEKLYSKAKEYANLAGNELLLDLYCGAGTIGLSMAHECKKLIGVEIIPDAIKNAKENAKRNKITNAEFRCGDAADIATHLAEQGTAPDVIILDPPRKGCDTKTLDAVIKMSPERIVMISCNPATAARDVSFLEQNNYKAIKAQAFDLFPRTTHVETVCLLSKLNTKQHIEVDIHMDELDLTDAEKKATYQEIKEYVLVSTGLKVSSLNIAQVKQKCGIIERENYNKPKSEDTRQPQCPPDKEKAIKEALLHFGMI